MLKGVDINISMRTIIKTNSSPNLRTSHGVSNRLTLVTQEDCTSMQRQGEGPFPTDEPFMYTENPALCTMTSSQNCPSAPGYNGAASPPRFAGTWTAVKMVRGGIPTREKPRQAPPTVTKAASGRSCRPASRRRRRQRAA